MSTVGYIGKTTNWTEDYIGAHVQEGINGLWGPIDGEVVSYDAATQTATVQPLYRPVFDGEPTTMPELYEVPIEFPRTGNSAITSPVPAGTRVRLTPMMRSAENYDTEDDGEPSDTRAFHLSDMRASITGGDSLTSPLPNVDPDNLHIRANAEGTYGLKASPDGKFEITGAQGNVYELYNDAIDECQKIADALKDEPALTKIAVYAAAATALGTILGKLRAMQL